MNQLLLGALLALVVVLLALGSAVVVALIMNHSDRLRHEADAEAATKRHREIKDAIAHSDRLAETVRGQYVRINGEVADLREVAVDHSEILETLQPGRRARRPKN